MGPTYLVMLMADTAALVLYRGQDETVARAAYEHEIETRSAEGGTSSAVSVVLAAIRAEAQIR